jgi:hypothetical protein
MLRRLLFALTIAATLPGFPAAAAKEVTWQDVAHAHKIVVASAAPVPIEDQTTGTELTDYRLIKLENPTFLKGEPSEGALYLAESKWAPSIVWYQPAVYFLESARKFENKIVHHILWPFWDMSRSARPGIYPPSLADRISSLAANNERYRKIGKTFQPVQSEPLLRSAAQDLSELSFETDPVHRKMAVSRLERLGAEIAPYLITRLQPDLPLWPSEEEVVPFQDINGILCEITGFETSPDCRLYTPGQRRHAIDAWHVWLGRSLSGTHDLSAPTIDWHQVARCTAIVSGNGRMLIAGQLPKGTHEPGEIVEPGENWRFFEITNARFLKGDNPQSVRKIGLGRYYRLPAASDENAIFFINSTSADYPGGNVEKGIVISRLDPWLDNEAIIPSSQAALERLQDVLADVKTYEQSGQAFLDSLDPMYAARVKQHLQAIVEASDPDIALPAVRELFALGEAAVPHLVTMLKEPAGSSVIWYYSELAHPRRVNGGWLQSSHSLNDAIDSFLADLTDQYPGNLFTWIFRDPSIRTSFWTAYIGYRLSTPEGRLALSSDPATSKAEAMRRTISAELQSGATRSEIEAFFARQGLSPVLEETDYYRKIRGRYQAVVSDANPDDDVEETVVVHIFLDRSFRMAGSDVRYLFDLYR